MERVFTTPKKTDDGFSPMLSKTNSHIVAILCVAIALVTSPSRAQDSPVVLQSATLETLDKGGQIKSGSIIFHKGKITAVGATVKTPETAKVISKAGKYILPAIIDPYRVIRVGGRGAATTRLVRIGGRLFRVRSRGGAFSTSFMRVGDNVDPYDLTVRPWLRSGIANINLVSTGYGQSVIARATPESKGTMLRGAGRLYTSVSNSPTTLDLLRRGLGKPATSTTTKTATAKTSTTKTSSTTRSATSRTTSSSKTTSPSAQLWADVKDGKAPIIVNVNSPAAVIHLMKVLEPHPKVKVVMVTAGATIYETMDLLKKRQGTLTLVLSPSIVTVPNTFNRFSPAKLAAQAKIPFALSMSLNEANLRAQQGVPFFALALNVRAGVSRTLALEAVTKRPAEILGLEKSLGTLAVGKAATLLVFSGDPLDPLSRLEQVYLDGSIVYDATR